MCLCWLCLSQRDLTWLPVHLLARLVLPRPEVPSQPQRPDPLPTAARASKLGDPGRGPHSVPSPGNIAAGDGSGQKPAGHGQLQGPAGSDTGGLAPGCPSWSWRLGHPVVPRYIMRKDSHLACQALSPPRPLRHLGGSRPGPGHGLHRLREALGASREEPPSC